MKKLLLLIITMVWFILLPGCGSATDLETNISRFGSEVGVFPDEFLRFSDYEQEAYVRGVIDGQYFLLETNSDPERDLFVQCWNSGLATIISEAKAFVEVEGEQELLMPWTLSRLVGKTCPKETRVQPKISPEYVVASTSKALSALYWDTVDEAEFNKKREAVEKMFLRGVLDGKVFFLHGHKSPKLNEYLKCLTEPGNFERIFRGMQNFQIFADNLEKSLAYDVTQSESITCVDEYSSPSNAPDEQTSSDPYASKVEPFQEDWQPWEALSLLYEGKYNDSCKCFLLSNVPIELQKNARGAKWGAQPARSLPFVNNAAPHMFFLATVNLYDQKGQKEECTACTGVVGGAIFEFSQHRWVIKAKNQFVAGGLYHGAAPDAYIQRVGPNKFGVLWTMREGNQGHFKTYLRLVAEVNGKVEGLIDEMGGDHIIVAEEMPALPLDGTRIDYYMNSSYEFIAGRHPKFYDLKIISGEKHGPFPYEELDRVQVQTQKTRIFTFDGESYKLLSEEDVALPASHS
jgi:hypothetical protein